MSPTRTKMARIAVAAIAVAAFLVATTGLGQAGEQTPITVTKVVSGTEPQGASYVIQVSCIGSGFPNHQTNLNFGAGGGSQQFTALEPGYEGDCTFTETTSSGATPLYACLVQQQGAATCGGGGAAPATLNVNDPSPTQLATITVTNTFTETTESVTPVDAAPSGLTG